jgi:preprotein translocase subunit SecE
MASTKVRGKAARAVAARPPPEKRSRFSRAFGRFSAGRAAAANRRTGNLGALLRETRQELKKVEWPTREEATKLTAAVVGLSAVVGIFLGGVDFIFQELFKALIALSNGGM